MWGERGCGIGRETEEPLSASWGPHQSPGAATEITTARGLATRGECPSRVWRPGSEIKVSAGPTASEVSGEEPCCLSRPCWDHQALAGGGGAAWLPHLPLSPRAFFRECPRLESSPPFCFRTPAVGFRAHPTSRKTSSLNPTAKTLFPMRPYSQVVRVRTWTHPLRGPGLRRTRQTRNPHGGEDRGLHRDQERDGSPASGQSIGPDHCLGLRTTSAPSPAPEAV